MHIGSHSGSGYTETNKDSVLNIDEDVTLLVINGGVVWGQKEDYATQSLKKLEATDWAKSPRLVGRTQ